MKRCDIIGISDKREQWFSPEVTKVIQGGKVFSGGKRHREIMDAYLPLGYEWIDITVPLSVVFEKYGQFDDIVIFASGDPLFYGFASTIQREFPTCEMKVFPSFNSLQMLAHRMLLPYQDMHVVSLTGRPWDRFDEALILGYPLIGVLTDRKNTPKVIWKRMQEFGYTNYTMTIGENLGNDVSERVYTIKNEDYTEDAFGNEPLCCLILQKTADRPRPLGIPESAFALLDGRAKMITKMPIRLLSLSMFDLRQRRSFWDVGFCTGSVSIEAKLQFPHLTVTAFEVREQGRQLMQENARRFGTPGITALIGDFMETSLDALPRPDAVFIGGHGGKLVEMIERLHAVMLPGGCLVFNSVSESSRQLFLDGIARAGLTLVQEVRMAVDEHNPIYIMKAEKK